MNANALKGYIISRGFTIEKLVEELNKNNVSISKNTFYRNLKGEQQFDRIEILMISKILRMTDEDIMNIFFNEKVSF
nr:MAG TPA: Regulatory protein-modification, helix-turn-helix, transcriptional regulator, DNA [Caudoviricetes sp.]